MLCCNRYRRPPGHRSSAAGAWLRPRRAPVSRDSATPEPGLLLDRMTRSRYVTMHTTACNWPRTRGNGHRRLDLFRAVAPGTGHIYRPELAQGTELEGWRHGQWASVGYWRLARLMASQSPAGPASHRDWHLRVAGRRKRPAAPRACKPTDEAIGRATDWHGAQGLVLPRALGRPAFDASSWPRTRMDSKPPVQAQNRFAYTDWVPSCCKERGTRTRVGDQARKESDEAGDTDKARLLPGADGDSDAPCRGLCRPGPVTQEKARPE